MSKPTRKDQDRSSPKDSKTTKNQKKQENKSPLREYARYSTLGFQMLVVILLFTWGGVKLDEHIGGESFPWFTLLGAILGVVLGIYYAIRDFIKF